MTQLELLAILAELVKDAPSSGKPGQARELAELGARIKSSAVTLDSPLSEFGWDSVQMTWILIRLEERYDIDTSTVSMFNLFTVGDLMSELTTLINQKA
jgi:acyl carrier protein